MKATLLAVAAACLAVPSHTVDVKVVGDEASGIFTKIISDVPGAASDAAAYSADDNVEPIFYDAQGRRKSTRRKQQGSYLEQPNRYQNQNLFSAASQNSIRRQQTQAGIKYDNFGRPIQTFGSQAQRPSSIYQNRLTAGQSGQVPVNQFGQRPVGFSQGTLVGQRQTNSFDATGFGGISGRPIQSSLAQQQNNQQFGLSRPTTGQQFGLSRPTSGQQFGASRPTTGQQFGLSRPTTGQQFSLSRPTTGQQFGASRPTTGQQFSLSRPTTGQQFGPTRPTTGQQFPNQFASQQAINQLGQLNPSGGTLQPIGSQFGQQLGTSGSGQFGQFGQQGFSQHGANQFGQQAANQFSKPVNNQFSQNTPSLLGQQPSNQFGQQISTSQFRPQPGSGFSGQRTDGQFGQQSFGQFGQQSGSQFGQQGSSQFGQQGIGQAGQGFLGQQSGFQSGIRSVGNQFNRKQEPLSGIIGRPLRGNEIDSQRITGHSG